MAALKASPKRSYRFEVWQGMAQQWRFRLVAPNGETVASGAGYTRKGNCLRAVARLKREVATARAEVLP